MKKIILIFIVLLTSTICYATPPDRPAGSVAISGQVISSSAYNTDINTIYTYLSGGVDTYLAGSITGSAISNSAGISYGKLSLANSIVNADIATGAAISYAKLNLASAVKNTDLEGSITDSKLNSITTAGKVNFTALIASSQAGGDIPYFNGTSWTRLDATGSALYFLKSQGTTNPPVWTSIPPNLSLLSTTSFSNAADSGTISLNNGKAYKVIAKIHPAATNDNFDFTALINGDTGANYSGGASNWLLGTGIGYTGDLVETFELYPDYTDAKTYYIQSRIIAYTFGTGAVLSTQLVSKYTGASNVASFKLLRSAGNITGTVWVYEYGQ